MRGPQFACSPDGRWIAYPTEKGLHLMSPGGKDDRVLIPGPLPQGRSQFGEGGRVLYRLAYEKRELSTWEVATGRKINSIVLAVQPGETVSRFSVHPDGRRILVQVGRVAYDLWLAENFARPAPAWRRWLQHWDVPFKPLPARPEQP